MKTFDSLLLLLFSSELSTLPILSFARWSVSTMANAEPKHVDVSSFQFKSCSAETGFVLQLFCMHFKSYSNMSSEFDLK